jgi:MGT family glycosyltransferase
MSSFLLTCTPAHGHVAPLLAVARHLVASGHRVRMLTSSRYADRVRAAGAVFLALPPDADVNLDDPDRAFPERVGLRGPAALRFDMINLFLRPGPAQFAAVTAALSAERTDAVLTEQLFMGTALLNELPRAGRPPIVALGIFPLGVKSPDVAPFGLGAVPLAGVRGRIRNAMLTAVAEKVIFAPITREAHALARETVGRPLRRFFLDWASGAEAIVQFTVPEFEYPRRDLPSSVHFVGPLAPATPASDVPSWWADLDDSRPMVHLTQGTIANFDFSQLIAPTLEALADLDVTVTVTTGGRPVDELPPLPANARAAAYLPYDQLLPLTDVLVTNGGYGGVQQALAHGIPLVVAGQTEDKVEVSARVGWSGAGINLKTNRPSAGAVRAAVVDVLNNPSYRGRARRIGEAIARTDALAGLDAVLAEVTGSTTTGVAADAPGAAERRTRAERV